MALCVKENIEMELFSSEEPCVVTKTQEEDKEQKSSRGNSEHPLVFDSEEDSDLMNQSQCINHINQANTMSPGCTLPTLDKTLIEMEALPSLKMSRHQKVNENKSSRLKWKRVTPQRSRFEVRDVVCIPKDQYMDHIESHVFSQRNEVSTTTARMTVDHSWSATEMETRLRMVFRREFGKSAAKSMTFTYLQCVQSSKALFTPDSPTEGWTGAQVLRISALGPLYVLIHQDLSQDESEQPFCQTLIDNRKLVCLMTNENETTITKKSLEELRQELQSVLGSFTPDPALGTQLQVERAQVLRTALKAVRRSGFCFRTTPLVSFTGEHTEGQQGPVREFFRLTLLELQKTCLFEGQPGRLLLTSDLSALEDWRYYEAGVLIGWSLAHGGPGPRCLHLTLFQLMCGRDASLDDFSWRDVADIEKQSYLQELQSCSDVSLLSPGLCEWVSLCGVPNISLSRSEEIPHVYRRVVKHYIHDRVAGIISQFTEGLNSCDGLWDQIKSHCESFVPVMTCSNHSPLTHQEFKQLFTVTFTSDCEELRAAENQTVQHWDTVLSLISDGQATFSFEDLLVFVSGLDHIPPLGFSSSISLRFYSQGGVLSGVRLPFASTCTLELFLPRGIGCPTELLVLLTRAVHESLGFTHLKPEHMGTCI